MDFEKAFTYIKDDERWMTKLGIGTALVLASIFVFPAFLLAGYMVQIMRNVSDGIENPLPEWEDWGTLLIDGFTIFGAQLVYTFPLWLIICLAGIATMGASATGSGDLAAVVGGTSMLLISCLTIIFVVAWIFLAPAIAIQYVREETFASCFRFGEVITIIRDNAGDIVMITVAFIAVQFVAMLVTSFLNIICIGWIFTLASIAYLMMARGHLYGQLLVKMDGGKKDVMFE